jgi:hypothetical protein
MSCFRLCSFRLFLNILQLKSSIHTQLISVSVHVHYSASYVKIGK